MGAQAAALLTAGGPLGRPVPFTPAVVVPLDAPAGWSLRDVALSHGGAGLAPWSWDGTALGTVLPDGTRARVRPDLEVELSAPTDLSPLERALGLHADLDQLWAVAPHCRGEGWELRAMSPFEALVQALAATNTSYRSTQAMVAELVGDGPVPSPTAVPALPLQRWGYRLPALRELAEVVDDTDWDALDDQELVDRVRQLRGFGAFAAASALPLMGRPRSLLLDGWLAAQVEDPRSYEQYGRWAGTVLWLDVSRRWRRAPRTP